MMLHARSDEDEPAWSNAMLTFVLSGFATKSLKK